MALYMVPCTFKVKSVTQVFVARRLHLTLTSCAVRADTIMGLLLSFFCKAIPSIKQTEKSAIDLVLVFSRTKTNNKYKKCVSSQVQQETSFAALTRLKRRDLFSSYFVFHVAR